MSLCITAAFAGEQTGLPLGASAPDFTAVTYEGKQITLADVNQDGPVVLVFYRGGWCPYCVRQLQDLQSRLEDFKVLGARLIAISVDRPEYSAKTAGEKQLGFDVVSNPDADLLELYGLVYQVPDDLAKKYKDEYGIDLEAASGRSDHVIAAPATYVIDAGGKIVYAFADPDYKIRPSMDDVLAALQELNR